MFTYESLRFRVPYLTEGYGSRKNNHSTNIGQSESPGTGPGERFIGLVLVKRVGANDVEVLVC